MVPRESPPASADLAPLGFQLLLKLCGHADSINEIVWSPDGATLASGSDDQTVRLWDIERGQLLNTLSAHQNDVMSVAWSPDGRILASGDRYDIRFWDVESGELLQPPLASNIYSIAWSPDNRTLASTAVDTDIYIWDMQNVRRRRVLKGHRDDVTSVAWSPDGRVLASGSSDRTVRPGICRAVDPDGHSRGTTT
jgi:WD40 repeat protein